MTFLSAAEVTAHRNIALILDDCADYVIPFPAAVALFQTEAGAIAPRCNCGSVLTFTRQPGIALVTCVACGFHCWECPL